jgi:hypothetical protein
MILLPEGNIILAGGPERECSKTAGVPETEGLLTLKLPENNKGVAPIREIKAAPSKKPLFALRIRFFL